MTLSIDAWRGITVSWAFRRIAAGYPTRPRPRPGGARPLSGDGLAGGCQDAVGDVGAGRCPGQDHGADDGAHRGQVLLAAVAQAPAVLLHALDERLARL